MKSPNVEISSVFLKLDICLNLIDHFCWALPGFEIYLALKNSWRWNLPNIDIVAALNSPVLKSPLRWSLPRVKIFLLVRFDTLLLSCLMSFSWALSCWISPKTSRKLCSSLAWCPPPEPSAAVWFGSGTVPAKGSACLWTMLSTSNNKKDKTKQSNVAKHNFVTEGDWSS